MKVVTTIVKICMRLVTLRLLQAYQRLCGYLKNITPNSIMIMSHWPFAKLLSFKTYTEDGIRVIRVHTCKIYLHKNKEAPINYKSMCFKPNEEGFRSKRHRLLLEPWPNMISMLLDNNSIFLETLYLMFFSLVSVRDSNTLTIMIQIHELDLQICHTKMR
jgi:hypothetical protein